MIREYKDVNLRPKVIVTDQTANSKKKLLMCETMCSRFISSTKFSILKSDKQTFNIRKLKFWLLLLCNCIDDILDEMTKEPGKKFS